MPRVCARCAPLLVLIALATGTARPARAGEMPRHMGLYIVGHTTKPSPPAEVPLVASSIDATAHGPLIEVVTTQRFTNTGKHAIEAVYVFPLPPDADVSAMSIRHGDTTIHAEIAPRAQAQARHEAAVAAGVVGALFEQERPDVFTQTITGIAPGATVEIELRWDTIAARHHGDWELAVPLVVAPRAVPGTPTGRGVTGSGTSPDTDRASDASRVTPPVRDDGKGVPTAFTLVLDQPGLDVTSPTHELEVKSAGDETRVATVDDTGARDLIVRWKSGGKPRGWMQRDTDDGFVAVTVEAGAVRGRRSPVRVVVAIDDPGAAAGDAGILAHRVERGVLGALGAVDRYAVRGKDGGYRWHRLTRATPAGTLAAAADPRDLVATITSIQPALGSAGGKAQAFLITDGLVADDAAVIAAAKALGVAIHVIGVGAAPNRALILAIAAATGGTARFVSGTDDALAVADAAVADAAHPAARAPTIDWGGLEVIDAVPATLPRLGAGQAITVLGRTAEPRPAKARVDGAGFAIEIEPRAAATSGATSSHGLIARLWARARIAELIAHGAAAADVSRVGLSYGVVTPYTAMIAVGEEVVDQAGTRRSVAVPVALPGGMRTFEAVVDHDGRNDEKKDEENTEHRPAKEAGHAIAPEHGTGDRGRSPRPVSEPPVDRAGAAGGGKTDALEDTKGESKGGDTGKGTGTGTDTGTFSGSTSQENRQSLDTSSVGGEPDDDAAAEVEGSTPARVAMMDSPSETISLAGSSVGRRRGLRLSLRGGGGLEIADGVTRGMGTVGGQLGLGVGGGRFEVGSDLSLWIAGRDADVSFRALLSTTVNGLASGWLDLSLGAGLHLGDQSGVGYAAGLRFGRGRLGPLLRWDGAFLRGADKKLHSAGALDLTLELSF